MEFRAMVYCEHANENPCSVCKCPPDCGCRERMCKLGFDEADAEAARKYRAYMAENKRVERAFDELGGGGENCVTTVLVRRYVDSEGNVKSVIGAVGDGIDRETVREVLSQAIETERPQDDQRKAEYIKRIVEERALFLKGEETARDERDRALSELETARATNGRILEEKLKLRGILDDLHALVKDQGQLADRELIEVFAGIISESKLDYDGMREMQGKLIAETHAHNETKSELEKLRAVDPGAMTERLVPRYGDDAKEPGQVAYEVHRDLSIASGVDQMRFADWRFHHAKANWAKVEQAVLEAAGVERLREDLRILTANKAGIDAELLAAKDVNGALTSKLEGEKSVSKLLRDLMRQVAVALHPEGGARPTYTESNLPMRVSDIVRHARSLTARIDELMAERATDKAAIVERDKEAELLEERVAAAERDRDEQKARADRAERNYEREDLDHAKTIRTRDHFEEQINHIADALGDETEWSNCNDRGENARELALQLKARADRAELLNGELTRDFNSQLVTLSKAHDRIAALEKAARKAADAARLITYNQETQERVDNNGAFRSAMVGLRVVLDFAQPAPDARDETAQPDSIAERAAKICESMVIGGRAWNEEQSIAADCLFAAAKNIRRLLGSEKDAWDERIREERDHYRQESLERLTRAEQAEDRIRELERKLELSEAYGKEADESAQENADQVSSLRQRIRVACAELREMALTRQRLEIPIHPTDIERIVRDLEGKDSAQPTGAVAADERIRLLEEQVKDWRELAESNESCILSEIDRIVGIEGTVWKDLPEIVRKTREACNAKEERIAVLDRVIEYWQRLSREQNRRDAEKDERIRELEADLLSARTNRDMFCRSLLSAQERIRVACAELRRIHDLNGNSDMARIARELEGKDSGPAAAGYDFPEREKLNEAGWPELESEIANSGAVCTSVKPRGGEREGRDANSTPQLKPVTSKDFEDLRARVSELEDVRYLYSLATERMNGLERSIADLLARFPEGDGR